MILMMTLKERDGQDFAPLSEMQDSIVGFDNEALFEQVGTASWARIVWPRSVMA
jgi:hypothetical protein